MIFDIRYIKKKKKKYQVLVFFNNRTVSIKHTYWKTRFHMTCKEGQFDVVELKVNEQFKTFSINLNAQHVNGMTPFDLAVHMYGY